jgi:hypothetical protein
MMHALYEAVAACLHSAASSKQGATSARSLHDLLILKQTALRTVCHDGSLSLNRQPLAIRTDAAYCVKSWGG